MKSNRLIIIRIGAIIIFFLNMTSLQTASWFSIFNYFPSPLFWFPIIIYISLYREDFEGIFLIYVLTFSLSTLTSSPIGVLFTLILGVWAVIKVIKERFFIPGIQYFLVTTALSCLVYQILQLLLSVFIEGGPFLENLVLLERFTQILLTPLIALPIYYVLRWLDRITKKETKNYQRG